MRFKQAIAFLLSLVLLVMLVCPAIAAMKSPVTKAQDHCASEKPPEQNQKQTMRGCCDESAISVQKIRAPFDSATFSLVSITAVVFKPIGFAADLEFLPFQDPSKQLSKLSILRL
jgi:hypothetical protein